MTLPELASTLHGRIAVDHPTATVSTAYTSDLLSDVMGHCGDESALVTIQNHLNTIAVCTLVGVEILVICHDRPIPDEMAAAAAREGIAIVTTPLSQFEASVALSALRPAKKDAAH
jgi:hypothetical protein